MKDSTTPVRRQPSIGEMTRLFARHLIPVPVILDALNLKFRSKAEERDLEIKDIRKGGKYYKDYYLGRLDATMELFRANIDRGRNLTYYMNELTPELMKNALEQIQAEQTITVKHLNYDEYFEDLVHDKYRDQSTRQVH